MACKWVILQVVKLTIPGNEPTSTLQKVTSQKEPCLPSTIFQGTLVSCWGSTVLGLMVHFLHNYNNFRDAFKRHGSKDIPKMNILTSWDA